jgi:hypothetical protein
MLIGYFLMVTWVTTNCVRKLFGNGYIDDYKCKCVGKSLQDNFNKKFTVKALDMAKQKVGVPCEDI